MITKKSSKILKYTLAYIAVLLFVFPLYVIINNSLKPFADVRISEMWIPAQNLSFEGYAEAFVKLGQNIQNSFMLVIPVSLFSVMFGAIIGFIFAKVKFKYSNTIFALVIFGMFIPYQSILIPLVRTMNNHRVVWSSVWTYGDTRHLWFADFLTHVSQLLCETTR